MINQHPKLNNLVDKAISVFGEKSLYQNYRLPTLFNWQALEEQELIGYKPVKALWTTDGLRPRWDNLAILTDSINNEGEIENWKKLINGLNIRYALLASENNLHLITKNSEKVEYIQESNIVEKLEHYRTELFSPRVLSKFKEGQLTFADVEESISRNNFGALLRQKGVLTKALKTALKEANLAETQERIRKLGVNNLDNNQLYDIYESVLSVSTAFLAARILEDKGFFGEDQKPTNDPLDLLKQTVTKQNGFFKIALDEHLPKLSVITQQYLAKNLGSSISFSLVDHQDVGHLYEQASLVWEKQYDDLQNIIGTPLYEDNKPLINLQRHYTPFAIADKMLKALPIERIRPENRRIIDLAAGSGTLLLASTLRLASMLDTPDSEESRTQYLKSRVVGNDIDKLSSMVTKLRYILIDQSVGGKSSTLFPMPEFYNEDYNNYTSKSVKTMLKNPSVWVANPPYVEEGKQSAFEFIKLVSSWMRKKDQFAFVLPQSFIEGTSQGAPEARDALLKNSNIHEIWQLPERYVGISAQQQVCIVVGTYGENNNSSGKISRTLISRRRTKELRNKGFLGPATLSYDPKINPKNYLTKTNTNYNVEPETLTLEKVYFAFNGVNLNKNYPPIAVKPEDIKSKRFWRTKWLKKGCIWADPKQVDPNERYVLYDERYMNATRHQNQDLFDRSKLIVARARNRDTKDILAAHIDTTGFCINNAAYSITPLSNEEIENDALIPMQWKKLKDEEKLLFLLGVLISPVSRHFLLNKKVGVNLPIKALKDFPLPKSINFDIIRLTEQILNANRDGYEVGENDPVRIKLYNYVLDNYELTNLELNSKDLNTMVSNWDTEQEISTIKIVMGQVLEKNAENNRIKLFLTGIMDEKEVEWISLPNNLPGWALNSVMFTAELSEDINTFEQITERPWALRNFKHSPRPYLTVNELKDKLISK